MVAVITRFTAILVFSCHYLPVELHVIFFTYDYIFVAFITLQTYGEMTPEMVAEVLPRLGLTREKLFVDLGSALCFIRDQ